MTVLSLSSFIFCFLISSVSDGLLVSGFCVSKMEENSVGIFGFLLPNMSPNPPASFPMLSFGALHSSKPFPSLVVRTQQPQLRHGDGSDSLPFFAAAVALQEGQGACTKFREVHTWNPTIRTIGVKNAKRNSVFVTAKNKPPRGETKNAMIPAANRIGVNENLFSFSGGKKDMLRAVCPRLVRSGREFVRTPARTVDGGCRLPEKRRTVDPTDGDTRVRKSFETPACLL